jgi:phage FluMu protein Com
MQYKITLKSPFYSYLKKHFCPKCKTQLKVKFVSKIVHSESAEAKYYNFQNVDNYMFGNVKFIWNEFKCPTCNMQINAYEMKQYENKKGKCKNNLK